MVIVLPLTSAWEGAADGAEAAALARMNMRSKRGKDREEHFARSRGECQILG
jgi:hypothetical protein